MKSNIRIQKCKCYSCGKTHEIEIDLSKLTKDQFEGKDPIMTDFRCPDVAVMYRVIHFFVDVRVNAFHIAGSNQMQDEFAKIFRNEWGNNDFDAKLQRYVNLNLAFIGIPEEYHKLLWPVISSYCCGQFFPAMTSCGALGERILNILLLKTREYFKSSEHYKKIYKKQSFDQWDFVIKILIDWNIISIEVSELFRELKIYRNDSIHYNNQYDYEKNSHDALKLLTQIIEKLFGYTNRTDLFWVFDIPGEIWLRSEKLNDPFVKEFVLPHCLPLTPFCEPFAKPPIMGKNAPLKPLTDEQFIEIRKNRRNNINP